MRPIVPYSFLTSPYSLLPKLEDQLRALEERNRVRAGQLAQRTAQQPGLSGPPWYTTWSQRAAAASIRTLARLEPTVLAGGHGTPMTDPGTPARLRAFAGLAATD